jgi:hypothetical protein
MHPMTPASITRFTIASLLCAGLLGTAGCSSTLDAAVSGAVDAVEASTTTSSTMAAPTTTSPAGLEGFGVQRPRFSPPIIP